MVIQLQIPLGGRWMKEPISMIQKLVYQVAWFTTQALV